jgi:hypothetical protein
MRVLKKKNYIFSYQKGREETFYDLMLYIKGNKNIEESLM